MLPTPERHALHVTVMWHGVAALPRLRQMDFAERLQVLQEADEHAARQPLHLTSDNQYVVATWSDQPLTGGQVLALLVFGLWVHCGESEETTGSLLHDWPIILDAVGLADQATKGIRPEKGPGVP